MDTSLVQWNMNKDKQRSSCLTHNKLSNQIRTRQINTRILGVVHTTKSYLNEAFIATRQCKPKHKLALLGSVIYHYALVQIQGRLMAQRDALCINIYMYICIVYIISLHV